MSKNWKLKPHVPEEFCKKFPEFSTLGAQLLYNRDLKDKDQIEHFFQPQYEDLHDPFLFRDMKKAVERIWQAIEQNELICIYGDYDADAVTANAVLQQTFKYLGVDVSSYIPDRFTEGYGLNLEAFGKIRDNGSKLVITVDCGTNSADVADYCKANGIDLIITDHHEILGEEPDAYALINPKNNKDKYPYHEITGVGVAFKLACGVLSDHKKVSQRLSSRPNASAFRLGSRHPERSRMGESRDPEPGQDLDPGYFSDKALKNSGMAQKEYSGGFEKWLLDLVAIGTVADCHSLLGENRILVKYGLKVLAKSKWAGLRALCRGAGLDFNQKLPDTYTLGFVVAPRLNAAGRLRHADIALHLLMEKDPVKAAEKALELELINKERQVHTERILSEAREQALQYNERKILVLLGLNWPKGVVGLVAGKLVEEFNKPVIVMEKGEIHSTGSARTVGDFDLVEALKYAQEHLVRFGGHKQAAGLTLKTSEYEIFYQKILEFAESGLSEEDLEKTLELEAELTEENLQLTTYNLLTKFEPFGVGNPRPKFWIKDLQVLQMRPVGATKKHMQFFFQKGDKKISGIGFNLSYIEKIVKVGDTIDVAAEMIEDGWNGRKDVKLRIIDIRKSAN